MNDNNGGTHISIDIAQDALRPVGIWDKNSITVLWLLLVSRLCLLIFMDISIPYVILKYNPKDVLYGFVFIVAVNCYYGGVMCNQARDLMEASETVDDVPWWCYGCTSSTRPKERPVALWNWVSAKIKRISDRSESSLLLAEVAARGQRDVVLWNKNQINSREAFVDTTEKKYKMFLSLWGLQNGFLLSEHARLLMEAFKTVHDVPWWCHGCTKKARPEAKPE